MKILFNFIYLTNVQNFQFLLFGGEILFSVTASEKVHFTPKLETEKVKRINIK